jgi:hypothetical protein
MWGGVVLDVRGRPVTARTGRRDKEENANSRELPTCRTAGMGIIGKFTAGMRNRYSAETTAECLDAARR